MKTALLQDIERPHLKALISRLSEPRKFIDVISGPRQVGKTTLIHQAMAQLNANSLFVTADGIENVNSTWLEQQWESARILKKSILVIDEIQKISNWSELVKKHWDQDSKKKIPLKIVLLGSSPLLIQKGLTESLAGRFELFRVMHWSYPEVSQNWDATLEEFLYYGGYPGSLTLTNDLSRFKNYIRDSLIETSISKDILQMNRVDKPALLKSLFWLATQYSSQILSYQKMVGSLQDAGNTTTLAHYLNLLQGAGLVCGLQKISKSGQRTRASSPKLQVYNTALITAFSPYTLQEAQLDRDYWGRLVESAIGAHLINQTTGTEIETLYWREGDLEVDFVLRRGQKLVAIEVKSGAKKGSLPGIAAFSREFGNTKKILVGTNEGIPIQDFLNLQPEDLF